jgi:hypothetical protein
MNEADYILHKDYLEQFGIDAWDVDSSTLNYNGSYYIVYLRGDYIHLYAVDES